jgi:hypothetical protein
MFVQYFNVRMYYYQLSKTNVPQKTTPHTFWFSLTTRLVSKRSFVVFETDFKYFPISEFSGQAFTIMLVYVWARRNPFVRMNFFGLVTFQAPYLPWVLLGVSLLIGNSVSVDLVTCLTWFSSCFLST